MRKEKHIPWCTVLVFMLSTAFLFGEILSAHASKDTYIQISGLGSYSFCAKYLLSGTNPPGFYPMRFRDSHLDLRVKGRLKDKIGIEGSLVDSRYLIGGIGSSFVLTGSNFEAHIGDYNGSFEGTEFALRDRSLTGVKGKAGYRNVTVEALYSISRGQAHKMRIPGDGTQGPYQFEYVPVVYGSERVKVGRGLDLKEMKKGEDYEIDYIRGTITFIDRVIKSEETIEIQYESQSGSAFESSLWGAHTILKAQDRGHLGFSFLEEKDRIGDFSQADTATTKPSGQRIYGIDGGFSLGTILKMNGEICASRKQPNLFSSERIKGGAYKIETSSTLNRAILESYYKRIEPSFKPIGKIGYGPNTTDWGIKGNYQLMEPVVLSSSFRNYRDNERREIDKTGSIEYSKSSIGLLSYGYVEEKETMMQAQRTRKAHTGRFRKDLKYLAIGTRYSRDRNTFISRDSVESYVSHIIGGDMSLKGFSKFSLSINGETEQRSNQQKIHSAGMNVSLTPSSKYSLSSNATIIKDSREGNTRMVGMNYRVRPNSYAASNGKYTIKALRRGIYSTEPVETHTGSFRNELTPHKIFRFIYVPNLKFTRLKQSKQMIYNSLGNRYITQFRPIKYFACTYAYETRKVLAYNEQTPFEKVADNRNNNKRTEIRIAPAANLSISTKYYDERGMGLYRTFIPQGQDTAADTIIQYKKENRFTFDNDINARIHKKASISLGYTFENYWLAIPDSTPTRTKKHILDSRLNQEINTILSVYLLSAYERKQGQDPFITGQMPNAVVYTFSPGAGIIVRIGSGLTGDVSYKFSKSRGDAFTFKETYRTSLNINLKYVTLSFLTLYNRSRDPHYRTLEGTLNLNMTL